MIPVIGIILAKLTSNVQETFTILIANDHEFTRDSLDQVAKHAMKHRVKRY